MGWACYKHPGKREAPGIVPRWGAVTGVAGASVACLGSSPESCSLLAVRGSIEFFLNEIMPTHPQKQQGGISVFIDFRYLNIDFPCLKDIITSSFQRQKNKQTKSKKPTARTWFSPPGLPRLAFLRLEARASLDSAGLPTLEFDEAALSEALSR